MGKNIVLCADGTGNKGGYTPDSNVYKIYHAIDVHVDDNEQVVFYDNGVGTATNKYLRALSAAVGTGFGQNVRDLYEFLVKNYEPGDQVYLFGFSRGAATVRAFSGFVAACGLIKFEVNGKKMSARELKGAVEQAFQEYVEIGRKHKPGIPPLAEKLPSNHGAISIKFIGVWDTVSALGFPERTDKTSVGMLVLNLMFRGLGFVADRRWPHKFYNYDLTENVGLACQALAIDDERTSFWPMVWDESGRDPGSVEQVWFAGMHSNVGGGYERSGLANVAFEWMLFRLVHAGDLTFKDGTLQHTHGDSLAFKDGVLPDAQDDAHVHGRLYDSRHGPAVYYRYHPREIQGLCKGNDGNVSGRIKENIRVHESVIRRMEKRTANYAPGHLPDTFDVVATTNMPGTHGITYQPHQGVDWKACGTTIARYTLIRKWLYAILLESTLAIVILSVVFLSLTDANWQWLIETFFWWTNSVLPDGLTGFKADGFMVPFADVLKFFTPDSVEKLIDKVVVEKPFIFLGTAAFFAIGFLIRRWAQRHTVTACEEARDIVLVSHAVDEM